ncbi:MAG TPA: cyclopropane-fatty-acyl-phospholipid synthase family protein [Solirubrobacteraceae bacterium]|nr:cyclopropane-fatty-acyl-phospholipid synthase family protein [Solirubrobacteraceae bacterium]
MPPGSGGDGTSVAAIAGAALEEVAGGRLAELPLTVRFWDGSSLPAATRTAATHTAATQTAATQTAASHTAASHSGGSAPQTDGGSGAPVVVAADRRALSHLLRDPGELGLARAWVDGSLTVAGDLEDVLTVRQELPPLRLTIGERLRLALQAVRAAGLGVLRMPPIPSIEATVGRRRLLSRDHDGGRRHSVDRDRRAVRHHYDVSNDFYRLLLGPSLVYSCAYFASPDDTLEEAQEHKLDLICRKLCLAPGERLLDIGCGWGSLVIHAASRYGVRAVGVTLSEPQAQLARERVREQGLQDRVEIRVTDYRELHDRPFQKIASVGMYEHVGRAELGDYVRTVNSLLAPGGLFLNHGIARLHSEPPSSDTFITRYVFPDGELHPVGDLLGELAAVGLEIRDLESLREHYPLTLRRWLANLRARRAEAVGLVGSERERAWTLYMLGSALAFERGDITVYQALAARGGASHRLPLDRVQMLTTKPAAVSGRD